ncbi:hypothetical protein [Candidatus Endomicrobiellum agilis]|uniref:hypothetical protein n=1 Tax=Candidatus Endomicrobiellum agilis TaxID=3238957 RepID=UPI00357EAE3A|nr:hypothetical protein [Endomicrobium sp.]
MRKIICVCVCLCICLMSGCDKLLSHGRPASTVVEDKGSEAPHSLASDTSNASASTPEPQPLSDSAVSSSWFSWHWYFPTINTGNIIANYALNIAVYALALVGVCYGGYSSLYRFADIKSISVDKLKVVENIMGNYALCHFQDGHFFSSVSSKYIDEIPVKVNGLKSAYCYIPNPSKLKPLLRKIFGIKTPVFKKFAI